MKATEPGVLLPGEPGGRRTARRKAAGWAMAGGGGGLAVEQLASSGLPSNEGEWISFGLRALVAIVGLLIGGKS